MISPRPDPQDQTPSCLWLPAHLSLCLRPGSPPTIAPTAAASKQSIPCARSPHITPVSTSPEPSRCALRGSPKHSRIGVLRRKSLFWHLSAHRPGHVPRQTLPPCPSDHPEIFCTVSPVSRAISPGSRSHNQLCLCIFQNIPDAETEDSVRLHPPPDRPLPLL